MQAFTIYLYGGILAHLPGASDTPTVRLVILSESRRLDEVVGFEVVPLRTICRLMPFQGWNLLTRHPVRIGCDLRSKVEVFMG